MISINTNDINNYIRRKKITFCTFYNSINLFYKWNINYKIYLSFIIFYDNYDYWI